MIYLDYAASAPLRPAARAAVMAAMDLVGNAASPHGLGRRAARSVEASRAKVAALVGAGPRQVVFTGGGTEANNLAIHGAAAVLAAQGRPRVAYVSAVEHASVRGPFASLAAQGWDVRVLPVDADGVVVVRDLDGASLVSVMAVNNEMGAVQPVAELAARAKAAGAVFHVDAVQGGGGSFPADLLSLSAHKLGGPQGVGALIVRPGLALEPLMQGGAHERGLRPGTVAVAAIAGFGAACDEVSVVRVGETARVRALRERLAAGIGARVPVARALGRTDAVAPHILALTFPGVVGEALIEQLDMADVAVSTGAACTVLGTEASPVLPALGLGEAEVQGSLRLSLGWGTTEAEIDQAIEAVSRAASMLLTMKPMAT